MTPKRVSLLLAVLLAGTVAFPLRTPTAAGEEDSRPLSSPYLDTDGNRIYDDLDRLLASASSLDTFSVLVEFVDVLDDASFTRLSDALGEFVLVYRYENVPGMAAQLTRDQIFFLVDQPEVVHVELDAEVQADLETARASTGVDAARHVFTGLDGDRDETPARYSKEDVVIAILDTGVDAGHVDLDGGKVLAFRDFVNLLPIAYDDNGHGTHVASTVAGTGEGDGETHGVAPGAALVVGKVLDSDNTGWSSDFVAGIDWVIANRAAYGIEVLNLSLSIPACSDGRDSVSLAVDRAVAGGIAVIASAGNRGPVTCTVGSPAAARGAITVGNVSDPGEGGFFLAPFSSRGPTLDGRVKPDLVAPGYGIRAARGAIPGVLGASGYKEMTGTSASAAFVSGVAALMFDADPELTPSGTLVNGLLASEHNRIRETLRVTALDWGPIGADVDYGAGRINAFEALDAIVDASVDNGEAGDEVPHVYRTGSLTADGEQWHDLRVDSLDHPLAVTMIMPEWSWDVPDFAMALYNPNGYAVSWSNNLPRQETITVPVTQVGNWRLHVYSVSGEGQYQLDISGVGALATNPRNLTAMPVAAGDIDLSWTAPETGRPYTYDIHRSTESSFVPSADTRIVRSISDTSYLDGDESLIDGVTYHYLVQAIDTDGNVSGESNRAAATADATAPWLNVVIKGGNKATNTTEVTVDLNGWDAGSGVAEMRLANESDPTGEWQPIQEPVAWTLTPGADGTRSVHAQVRDAAGNESFVSVDSIVLDTTPPVISAVADSPDPFSPGSSTGWHDETTLTATVEDLTDVRWQIVLSKDGTIVDEFVGWGSPVSATWAPGGSAAEGRYEYFVVASDAAGNAAAAVYGETTVDNTGPSVTGMTPPHGASGVSVDAVVSVTFDEHIEPATLDGALRLVSADGTAVSGAVSYAADTRTATFTPDAALAAATTYSMTIAESVRDLAGNPLGASVSWSFETEGDGIAPTAPTSLKAKAKPGGTAQLQWVASTDSGGSGLAGYEVWRREGDGLYQLIAATSETSFADSGLQKRVSYTYYVVAYDHAGNRSTPSNTATIKAI